MHTESDFTLITVVPAGTKTEVYPDTKEALGTLFSKGTKNPSTSEYKSNGPVLVPAIVKVINTVIIFLFWF